MHRTLPRMVLFLSETNVRQVLCSPFFLEDVLAVNQKALMSLASGRAQVPTRIGLPYLGPDPPPLLPLDAASFVASSSPQSPRTATDWSLFKPAAYLDAAKEQTLNMGIKVVSIRAGNNATTGLPLVPATIMLLDAASGTVNAIVSATELTAARTAAGSALATMACRNDRPLRHLVVFGAGLQAQWHIRTLATALGAPISRTTIINRSLPRAEQLATTILREDSCWANESHAVLLEDRLAVAEALSTADVIVTATNSTTPLFTHAQSLLPAGCHINGVGSYTPDMKEVPARTAERCRVYIDTLEAKQVGDLACLAQSVHPVSLLGKLLLQQEQEDELEQHSHEHEHQHEHQHEHHHDHEHAASLLPILDCTFYKAVGTAIQDVLTADLVVQKAREMGLGTDIDMS